MNEPTEDGKRSAANTRRSSFGFLNASWPDFDDPQSIRWLRREQLLNFSDDVYHYTTLAGFKGIVESRGFWLSDNRFMNDAEETSHGIAIASRVLSRAIRRSRTSQFASVLETVADRLQNVESVGRLVACFSLSRDSLEQWRGYGAGGGICLKIKNRKGAPLFYAPGALPFRAIYDTREKLAFVAAKVRRFEREYKLDLQESGAPLQDDHHLEYVKELEATIRHGIVGFKSEHFAQEREIRLTIPFGNDEFGALMFRTSPLGIVPYVCTGNGHKGKAQIEEVIVGPAVRQELLASSIRTFLDEHDHSDVAVNLSPIPFRG